MTSVSRCGCAAVLLLLFSCQENPRERTDFHFLHGSLFDDVIANKGRDQRTRYEAYVVSSLPNDELEMMRVVRAFNDSITDRQAIEMSYDLFYRSFYKESRKTPKDFVEDNSGGIINDLLGDHHEDFICSIRMVRKVHIDNSTKIEWQNSCGQ